MRHQGVQEVLGNVGNLVHSPVERLFIGFGRLGAATDLAHILERSGLNLIWCGVRFKVMQGPDIAAHKVHARLWNA